MKGRRSCNASSVDCSSHWQLSQRLSYQYGVTGMTRTCLVRNGHPTRAFTASCPSVCPSCSHRSRSGSCGAALPTRTLQPRSPRSFLSPDFGPFFVALIVPGAAIVDPGHRLTRIGGVPSPLFGASATILVAGLGWYLDHRGRTVGKRTTRSTF
jgi:hypothetical protein